MQSPVPSAWGCLAVFTLRFPGPWLAYFQVSSIGIVPYYYLIVNNLINIFI